METHSVKFDDLVARITQIGFEHHKATILENSRRNVPFIGETIREVVPVGLPVLVVSAGPSLYRGGLLSRLKFQCEGNGAGVRRRFRVVSTDGAYIQCLKAGIKPDWVITIDPHPTRIVRWFGDPDWKENSRGDDYFSRQDLDVTFRSQAEETNEENIKLVDGLRVPLVLCSTAPANVVRRTNAFDRYWFAPLVDDPESEGSLTRQITDATSLPALNTGGTVGTAAWAFANCVLRASKVAVCGMDYGYPSDTPLKNTQEWNLTGGDPELYPQVVERGYYTSPTYFWYRSNFLDLLDAAGASVVNCSGAGLLYGDRVREMSIEEWLKSCS